MLLGLCFSLALDTDLDIMADSLNVLRTQVSGIEGY
jgi:hypothetical protein